MDSKTVPNIRNKCVQPTPNTLNCKHFSTWVPFIWLKNTLILECNFACVMCHGTKIAQFVVHTPRTSKQLRVPETNLNIHLQKVTIRPTVKKIDQRRFKQNIVIHATSPKMNRWTHFFHGATYHIP